LKQKNRATAVFEELRLKLDQLVNSSGGERGRRPAVFQQKIISIGDGSQTFLRGGGGGGGVWKRVGEKWVGVFLQVRGVNINVGPGEWKPRKRPLFRGSPLLGSPVL